MEVGFLLNSACCACSCIGPTALCLTLLPAHPHPTPAGAAGWLKSTLATPGVAVKYSGVLNGIGEPRGAALGCLTEHGWPGIPTLPQTPPSGPPPTAPPPHCWP